MPIPLACRVAREYRVDAIVAAAPRAFATGEDRGGMAEQVHSRLRDEVKLVFLIGVQQRGAAEIERAGGEARVDRLAGQELWGECRDQAGDVLAP